MTNIVFNSDCIEVLKHLNDNEFDICITDPPYGIHGDRKPSGFLRNRHKPKENYSKIVEWDFRPEKIYFDEIKRISKNQIIFGYNYFADYLGNCKAPIVWDKKTGKSFFADGELIYTSYPGTLRIFQYQWAGCFQGGSSQVEEYIHPNQKPKDIYRWMLKKFAKKGDKIIDPFAGSGSLRIVCYEMGYYFYGCEKDKKHYDDQKKRYQYEIAKLENRFYIPEENNLLFGENNE